jgi:cyclopropane fatty-acyl-phospholipid synthase-like methyltransferase
MRISDTAWIEKWSKIRFAPRPRDFPAAVRAQARAENFGLFGTDEEPGSSLWLASLSEAAGDSFREGMTVLDYGCGAGRYAHFLRQRLKKFTYFGVEKPGSDFRHGEKSIKAARKLFRWDRRIGFDSIGSRLESNALARAEVVVLGSIFTHVGLDEVRYILQKLQPVVARGGKVVFSIFIADEHRLEGKGAYGFESCHDRAWFTAEQLQQLCAHNGWAAAEKESFVAQDVNLHRIFALIRDPGLGHSA